MNLSDDFDIKGLLRFSFPSILMMMFYSTYIIVDGYFISNYVGSSAYASVNLIGNYILLFPVFGTMIGSGGSALISMTMGQGDLKAASRQLYMLVLFSTVLAAILLPICFFSIGPVAKFLGADGKLLSGCLEYGHIICFILIFTVLQAEFQYFFSTAELPNMGLIATIVSGVLNIVLDWLFVGVFHWGLKGAAVATLTGVVFGGLFPIAVFLKQPTDALHFERSGLDFRVIANVCTNGVSELLSNVSIAVVGILYNFQLMRYSGEDGVCVYGVLQCMTSIFIAVFTGYAMGVTPIIGYHHGEEDRSGVKKLFDKSLIITAAFSVIITFICYCFAGNFADIFLGYDRELAEMAVRSLRIFSVSFLMMGFNIFASAFFTALNNGLVSGIISASRTLVLQVISVMILPLFFGLDGIWGAINMAEFLSLFVVIGFFIWEIKSLRNNG